MQGTKMEYKKINELTTVVIALTLHILVIDIFICNCITINLQECKYKLIHYFE